MIVDVLPGVCLPRCLAPPPPLAAIDPVDSSSALEISVTAPSTSGTPAVGGTPRAMSSDASESSDHGGELPGDAGAFADAVGTDEKRRGAWMGASGARAGGGGRLLFRASGAGRVRFDGGGGGGG